MTVLSVKVEIKILTKQTQSGWPGPPQTALMAIYIGELLIPLETNIEMVKIKTSTNMDTGY